MDSLNYSKFSSSIGEIFILAKGRAISVVAFSRGDLSKFAPDAADISDGGYAASAARKIQSYLGGELSDFDIELDLSGATPFQSSVWKELIKIPYGATRTYSDIARAIGSPKAQRAVGRAVGANPIAIIVPCHRVVAAGGLGGYSGGMEIKKRLLRIEGAM
ncbi:MAG: methylated-DNA--[protein]-cysteine S-methyltransferase [Deltaproteobacteria bacterium]